MKLLGPEEEISVLSKEGKGTEFSFYLFINQSKINSDIISDHSKSSKYVRKFTLD